MVELEFELTIRAATENEATRKAQAVATLLNELTLSDLEMIAHIAQHDKAKLNMARAALRM
ncbi:MAG: hypothetical protein MUC87_03580 [Bacteroidia bacterium]|jgi:hypothetical protein|nr:hypothetical protein [Bacteroidia bacterium]